MALKHCAQSSAKKEIRGISHLNLLNATISVVHVIIVATKYAIDVSQMHSTNTCWLLLKEVGAEVFQFSEVLHTLICAWKEVAVTITLNLSLSPSVPAVQQCK